jgi:hypothetical protein
MLGEIRRRRRRVGTTSGPTGSGRAG